MNFVEGLLLAAHVLVAVGICGFVLLQHGTGADMGAAFGSGSSGSLFGSAGSANFLSRTTAVLVGVFFLTSLGLTWYASSHVFAHPAAQQGVMERVPTKAGDIPAAPASPAAPGTSTQAPPADVPKTGPAPEGSKAGEVPK